MKKILAFFLLFFAISALKAETKFISHRGYCKDRKFPCNTIKAFERAFSQGFLGIELDVRITKDKHFVVTHDSKLSTTTTCSGEVSDHILSKIVNSCVVYKNGVIPESGIFNGRTQKTSPISSLRDVFKTFFPLKQVETIIVDIKTTSRNDNLIALRNSLRGLPRNLHNKVVLIVKDVNLGKIIKKIYPSIKIALEGKTGLEPFQRSNWKKYVYQNETHDMISLNVGLFYLLGWSEFQLMELNHEAERKNRPIMAWTINNEYILDRLMIFDFDYILTDLDYNSIESN